MKKPQPISGPRPGNRDAIGETTGVSSQGSICRIVLGVRIPIALTDRADRPLARLAASVALLLARQKREK